MTDFNREVEQMRQGEPAEGPVDVERTRTYVSPDGQTRTTTHYSHQRSEYWEDGIFSSANGETPKNSIVYH